MKTPIVVLASGQGSNFEAIARAAREGVLQADILAVLSDKSDSAVLEKARAWGFPAVATSRDRMLAEVKRWNPRWVVLAGYMRLLDPEFLSAFDSGQGYHRIVNVHPSLLPAFPGLDSYDQAFDYGAKLAGVTIHLVDQEVDSGAVCAQESFGIADCTSVEEVRQRGLAVEHRLYPQTLAWVLRESFSVTKTKRGRICVRPS